ncbi:hypothetical protein C7M84_008426 [Penaeus vannamei]|uniref:Uncharacterized protein n=1 Tax=Penaeus vannamei TaxID=6689 RepID=A0A423UAK6_PENVA|nr:hypothetical protein C7M84_008426 [Penaeus vannamei]
METRSRFHFQGTRFLPCCPKVKEERNCSRLPPLHFPLKGKGRVLTPSLLLSFVFFLFHFLPNIFLHIIPFCSFSLAFLPTILPYYFPSSFPTLYLHPIPNRPPPSPFSPTHYPSHSPFPFPHTLSSLLSLPSQPTLPPFLSPTSPIPPPNPISLTPPPPSSSSQLPSPPHPVLSPSPQPSLCSSPTQPLPTPTNHSHPPSSPPPPSFPPPSFSSPLHPPPPPSSPHLPTPSPTTFPTPSFPSPTPLLPLPPSHPSLPSFPPSLAQYLSQAMREFGGGTSTCVSESPTHYSSCAISFFFSSPSVLPLFFPLSFSLSFYRRLPASPSLSSSQPTYPSISPLPLLVILSLVPHQICLLPFSSFYLLVIHCFPANIPFGRVCPLKGF